jgi:Fis family transcriptional regulator, factor for inversion stimulation protein
VKAQLESIVEQMYYAGMRFDDALREFQKVFVLTVLRQHNGNQSKAAIQLGMHRNTLRRAINDLQIDMISVRESRRGLAPSSVSTRSLRKMA